MIKQHEMRLHSIFLTVQSSEILRRIAVFHRDLASDPETDGKEKELLKAELLELCAMRIESIEATQ